MTSLCLNVLGWTVIAVLWMVIVAGLGYPFGRFVVGPLIKRIRRWHRDRFRRKWRKGKWVPYCDVEPEGSTLAHYMAISPIHPWGTGIKRCWRHKLVNPALIATDYQQVIPVNRDTAWRNDKPEPDTLIRESIQRACADYYSRRGNAS